jgi:hypothetical protein
MAAEHRTRLTNDNRTIKNWRHDQHLNQAYFCRKTVRSPGTTSISQSKDRWINAGVSLNKDGSVMKIDRSTKKGVFVVVQDVNRHKAPGPLSDPWRSTWTIQSAESNRKDAFMLNVTHPNKTDYYIEVPEGWPHQYEIETGKKYNKNRTIYFKIASSNGAKSNNKTFRMLDAGRGYPAYPGSGAHSRYYKGYRRDGLRVVMREFGSSHEDDAIKRFDININKNRSFNDALLTSNLESLSKVYSFVLDREKGPILRENSNTIIQFLSSSELRKLKPCYRIAVQPDGLHIFSDSSSYIDFVAQGAPSNGNVDSAPLTPELVVLELDNNGTLSLKLMRNGSGVLIGSCDKSSGGPGSIKFIVH